MNSDKTNQKKGFQPKQQKTSQPVNYQQKQKIAIKKLKKTEKGLVISFTKLR
ncbi:hypothetical protein KKG83_05895 [Candidatus Micrarchaeota archaeon]|nr:hypothetical protein [Candidatus Micrarchaeota archaeon]MBU2476975.1 hypothetical protein [Candidatus Micrarchaeota archaeon]